MSQFNSDDHYIYYCGQESLRRNGVALIVNKRVWNAVVAAAVAKSLQWCPTLCDPIDGSPPGSPIPGILQTKKLEWVAISFSNAWKWKVKVKLLSRVRLLGLQPTRLFRPWDFQGKSTGVGCHCLLYWNAVLGCNLKLTEWSQFISETNHSISQ